MAEITTTERLPFPLAKPNPDTFVTQASEIGLNGQPLDEQVNKKADVKNTEDVDDVFYITDENGNVVAKLEGGNIRTKEFDSSQVAPVKVVYDYDFLITDANGYVVAAFKNGQLQTQKFNSSYAAQALNSDSMTDFIICDSSGNVIVEFADGHIKTKNFDSSQGGGGGGSSFFSFTQIY